MEGQGDLVSRLTMGIVGMTLWLIVVRSIHPPSKVWGQPYWFPIVLTPGLGWGLRFRVSLVPYLEHHGTYWLLKPGITTLVKGLGLGFKV